MGFTHCWVISFISAFAFLMFVNLGYPTLEFICAVIIMVATCIGLMWLTHKLWIGG